MIYLKEFNGKATLRIIAPSEGLDIAVSINKAQLESMKKDSKVILKKWKRMGLNQ